MSRRGITLVEVGPRDGFQSIATVIPTSTKIDLIEGLHQAGLRRMEATAFVSESAVPQLADAAEILKAASALSDMSVQVLVPNLRHAERALEAGANRLAFVLSVSDRHNHNNVRRTPMESVAEYARIIDMIPDEVDVRLNVATAFDCPFDGPMPADRTLALLQELIPIKPDAEICPCDTTGRVTPDRVSALLRRAQEKFPTSRSWAFHGHDTYGLGTANVLAAWDAGISVIDASFAGLGGCPFAPGATGNVATEDVVWMFEAMGVQTGVDIDRLIDVACAGAALPDAMFGGRVRDALKTKLCAAET